MRKNLRKWLLGVIAAVSLAVTACQGADVASGAGAATDIAQAAGNILGDLAESKASGAGSDQSGKSNSGSSKTSGSSGTFLLSDIPEYSGSPYVAVNGNVPYFSESDLTDVSLKDRCYPVEHMVPGFFYIVGCQVFERQHSLDIQISCSGNQVLLICIRRLLWEEENE